MRLTNVAHLRLPFGRLLGFDVRVNDLGEALPVSFDQARHVGAGSRAGSWMALSLRPPEPVGRADLGAAWLAVIARHQTLRSVFTPGPDAATLHAVDVVAGDWVEHPIGPGQAVNDALRDVLDEACSPYSRPSHRLCLLETAAGPTVIIGADHAHVDMWSMLILARDLLAALTAIREGRLPELAPAPPFADHTAALAALPPAPAEVARRWQEIIASGGGAMPRFPLPLGEGTPQHERVEVRDVFDVDASVAFTAQARADGVSTLSLAVSAMAEVTRSLAGRALRAVFPVHSRFDADWHDSVGWFITNAVLEVPSADPAQCATAVREAVRLGSYPLAELLAPWGGMPEAPGMFAISWLDLRRLPVQIDSTGLDAQYVGATIRTDGVMLWFILDDTGLHLRCRYPDTEVARVSVGGWLDALVGRLQDLAAASAGDRLHVRGRQLRVSRARRGDVPAIVGLLTADDPDAQRGRAPVDAYETALTVLARDRAHYLAVVRDDAEVVGTMQLTIVPGLSHGGGTRLLIEELRVAAHRRSQGIGSAMLSWAHTHGHERGATLAQVTAGVRAREFFARAGYSAGQVGLLRRL